MKTIQIPMNSNPFTVVINNNAYSYTAGETVEVPDEVAGVIEDALELVPKPKKSIRSGENRIAQLLNQTITEVVEEDFGGATKIVPYALAYCTSLENVEMPSGITEIGVSAFHSCTRLKSVEIPNSVTSIGSYAFYNCKGLEIVEISSRVTSIGNSAFEQCPNLKSVTILAETPPIIGGNAFLDISCTFYVPEKSISAYETALGGNHQVKALGE